MKGQHLFWGVFLASVLPLCLCGGCDGTEEIVLTPEGAFSVSFLEGKGVGRQYAAGELADYELVWAAYDLALDKRTQFIEGFEAGLVEAGEQAQAVAYRTVLEEAVTGNHFETAKDLGTRHARKLISNEQIQGVIHSSLGVSKGVSLGWKAGYIRGFAAQRVAERAAAGSVNEQKIKGFHKEAAATYHALRAAIGR